MCVDRQGAADRSQSKFILYLLGGPMPMSSLTPLHAYQLLFVEAPMVQAKQPIALH